VRQFHHWSNGFRVAAILFGFCIPVGSTSADESAVDRCKRCEHEVASITDIPGRPGWHCARSRNFRVVCHTRSGDARKIAEHCEKLRVALSRFWFPDGNRTNWTPVCDVIVHQNAASYLQAVGRGASNTLGSSDVRAEHDSIVARRIDLRADHASLLTAALPHEMTHVVVADWTKGNPLPLWADEGMAMVADSDEKQAMHARDLANALASRTEFNAAELFNLDRYPAHDRWSAYYAQSHALVAYLVKKDSPERFVKFVAAVQETGYDAALREHYSIDGANSLSHLWHSMSERKHMSVVMNLLKARDPMPTTRISGLLSLSSDH